MTDDFMKELADVVSFVDEALAEVPHKIASRIMLRLHNLESSARLKMELDTAFREQRQFAAMKQQ